MRKYNLRRNAEAMWDIIDHATARTAELDGMALTNMSWTEASDMISLLNSLDAIESASKSYEALAAAE